MRTLINKQTIKVDDHTAGQETNSEALHIHKTMNDGSGWLKIPLNGKEDDITWSTNFPEKKKDSIKSEIKKTLKKDPQKFQKFGQEITSALNRWHKGNITEEEAAKIAEKLAGYFDLKDNLTRTLIEKVKGEIERYKTVYESGRKNYFFIDQQMGRIEAGSRVGKPRI
jgi:hypothetical protein